MQSFNPCPLWPVYGFERLQRTKADCCRSKEGVYEAKTREEPLVSMVSERTDGAAKVLSQACEEDKCGKWFKVQWGKGVGNS